MEWAKPDIICHYARPVSKGVGGSCRFATRRAAAPAAIGTGFVARSSRTIVVPYAAISSFENCLKTGPTSVVLETPCAVPPQALTRPERWLAVRVPDIQIDLVIGHKVGTVNAAAPDR